MEEKIYFTNSRGNKLCGILSSPTNDKQSPMIVLCHGFSTSKDSNTCVKLQDILNKNKIATLRFDFFGHGESDGTFEEITISEAVDDTLNAIMFLKELGYKKIGLVGSSFGGITAMIIASKISGLFVLVLKSPVSNYLEKELGKKSKTELENWRKNGFTLYPRGVGKKQKLNYSFFEDFKNNDGYEAAKKIKIPTLIVHGDQDETVPIKQSKKTAGIIANCTLEIIGGADHKYSKPEHFQKVLDLIFNFIKQNLP